MKLIELLIRNGLEEITLIGDPDQAIYEWSKQG
ncbi:MAG: UvrD-helicase domain-containing protein [Pelosinus sp.]|nr:UvrD-helicase domain-containing protein [Pelosinus sp.]